MESGFLTQSLGYCLTNLIIRVGYWSEINKSTTKGDIIMNLEPHQSHTIFAEMLANEENKAIMLPIQMLNPKLYKDGNQWAYLLGENLQEGIAGFGDTVFQAAQDFHKAFYQEKIPKKKV